MGWVDKIIKLIFCLISFYVIIILLNERNKASMVAGPWFSKGGHPWMKNDKVGHRSRVCIEHGRQGCAV
jgi:hypothetical protein